MCSTAGIPSMKIQGLEILTLTATYIQNYTFPAIPVLGFDGSSYANMNFCNVTVAYTHPGWNDQIHVMVYLPSEGWNGRFQATGGGGFIAGGGLLSSFYMAPALLDGFAVATSDGGHSVDMATAAVDVSDWALSSPGNVNWHLLVDFASVTLHDMAEIGKAVTTAYYGTPPHHSYFYGASTGGRQGLMIAQRYPNDFDGIVALCPAINWAQVVVASQWPQLVMNQLNVYPPGCELKAITNEAISACDGLDGVEDGIISLPGLCDFDPHTVVGKTFDCDGNSSVITSAAATVAKAAWSGPRSATGEWQWFGIGKDADLGTKGMGVASTICDEDQNCKGLPFPITTSWIKYFVKRGSEFDISTITHEEWDSIFHASVNEYESVIGTADPDLSELRKTGAKMLSLHGLQDAVIPVNGSVQYYDRVLDRDPTAQDFFRLFLVPGASHSLDDGPVPKKMVDAIVKWVEEDIAPDTLRGIGKDGYGTTVDRDLCMYPRVQVYRSGDPTIASSFECTE
ncbi:Tannase/feruloyl esterase [Penicillium samsonianum]|uniref:Tannase/feruloyl esterase n=1 Tax=Penicillium samsonianum TaxID=1882272 RepID=UPI00254666EF|nr:Tannase/feruloyl esterase [Penicillium samsonianum]KAJ6149273.1 Tannase/feruloyl esterase [Penicillium samsonianum]